MIHDMVVNYVSSLDLNLATNIVLYLFHTVVNIPPDVPRKS